MTTKLQRDRNERYFVEAAKSLVISEGVSNVTVRKIADVAGFSYATIYNYFRNINHLLWHVAMSFIEDIVQSLEPYLGDKPYTLRRIREIYHEYVGYFLERPNVLHLIVAREIGEPPEEFRRYNADPHLALWLLTNLEDPECRSIGKDEVPILSRIITSSIHGMLSLYLSNKTDQNADGLKEDVNTMLEYLLAKQPNRTK